MANDNAVRSWAKDAFKRFSSMGRDKKVLYAWGWLKEQRQDPKLQSDQNLACAEHYMFARFYSANGVNGLIMAVLIPLYSGVKGLAYLIDISPEMTRIRQLIGADVRVSNLLRAGAGPTTPPSADQIAWGYRGIRDAALDPSASFLP